MSSETLEIKGTHNTAICYTGELEGIAADQIRAVCDRAEFADSKIRIMPDVHAGKGCTIGTTMTITDKIVPGMVGVDIGCGMETVELAQREMDYVALDAVIRREIPAGREIRRDYHVLNEMIELDHLRCAKKMNLDRARKSIGTLGSGNHFIEVDRASDGRLFLVVHSGSRHLGTEVAGYYQDEAYRQLSGNSKAQLADTIERLKAQGRHGEIQQTLQRLKDKGAQKPTIPKDLAYLTGDLFEDYLHDMKIVQQFAVLNRQAMVEVIFGAMTLDAAGAFTTIHNYIDTDRMILRKGAVSARKGEKLLIPINMRDGSLVCTGRGNDDWNQSAPHGAGRLMSRKSALASLLMEEFRKSMEGIYTTSVSEQTLDESPMAYKSADAIIGAIAPTADVIMRIKPVYNFKAGE